MILHLKCRGYGIGLDLPTDLAEAERTLSRLTEGLEQAEPVTIEKVSSPIPNLAGYIQSADLRNRTDIQNLNALAEKIDGMSQREQQIFSGALNTESINGVDDVLKVAGHLEDYTFTPGVTTDRELGRFLVASGYLKIEERLRPYINYESVGAEYYSNFGGAYSAYGYVRRRDQEPALDREEKPVFQVRLQAPDGTQQYDLDLPATDAWMDTARQNLRLNDIYAAEITSINCTVPQLAEMLPVENATLKEADRLAECIEEMQKTDGELAKYLATLTVENPETFSEALTIAVDLEDYELVPDDAAEYGEQVLRHIGADDELIAAIDGFMDFTGLGEFMMEEDGVRQTDYGLIRRLSEPFPEQQIGQEMF